MKSLIKNSLLIVVLLLAFTVFSGCMSSTGPTRATSDSVSSTRVASTQTSNVQGDFSSVTHLQVFTKKGHWTSGAEDDGIVIYPELMDVKDTAVIWSGYSLPVSIEIYSTTYDSNFKQVKDKLVYKGTGTISSWKDGNMFMGGGIQVPFNEMSVPSDKTYGWAYVTVTTPDGKSYSGKDEFTALTP